MMVSSKKLAVCALSVPGGTTGQRPVLPLEHWRYYRAPAELQDPALMFWVFIPGTTGFVR